MAQTILSVLIVILIIALVALAVLYFLGNKLQKRQVEQQQLLDAAAQTASILVIDSLYALSGGNQPGHPPVHI